MASNQMFLVIPGVLLMINISLLRITNNYTNPKIPSLFHTRCILELLFVIILVVPPC